MKMISWNVNGLRACVTKGFLDVFQSLDADIFALQETKLQPHQIDLELPGYQQFFNSAEKKGYSGTAIFTRREPLDVRYGIGIPEMDTEGRVITLDMGDYYFVTTYTPNSQSELARLDYRMKWDDAWRDLLCRLKAEKPVIACGDLNVAHTEIDLKNPKTNRRNAGFTDEEREKFSALLDAGFIDTWRYQHPGVEQVYSWWSYRFKAREKNAGWRIDYFVVSEDLAPRIVSTDIHTDIFGSDHCPVELVID
ncbi:MAG: exodeoxyribonuclease III [Peptococcaceae bacterium]|jgi:exodeoxyribonuclease-3|nr:exodeoxyribonuclease III [Peptococcaceae bacterium]MEE0205277.1 exodeoxyribonuclease III [Peptococcaceae bacterium]